MQHTRHLAAAASTLKPAPQRPTALWTASGAGETGEVRQLLDDGETLESRGTMGTSPLHVAAFGGHAEVVRLLLEHGAEISSQSNEGETALHWATYEGHAAVARLLLENRADISIMDDNGLTPLQSAVLMGHDEVRRLLQTGPWAPKRAVRPPRLPTTDNVPACPQQGQILNLTDAMLHSWRPCWYF